MRNKLSPEDVLEFTQYKFDTNMERFEKKPQHVTWELTNACNLRCKHCGLPDAGKPLEDELTTEEAYQVVHDLADTGVKSLLFSGGEALAREKFVDIAKYASKFFSVSLNTNGYLLKEYARQLKDVKLTIQLSLDGSEAQTHDFLRGEGSFERALEGIEECKQLGMSVSISSVIHKSNYRKLPEMIDLAFDLGAEVFEARAFQPPGRGKEMSGLALSNKEKIEMYQYLFNQQKEGRQVDSEDPYMFIVNELAQEACSNLYNKMVGIGCAAGIVGCAITPNGKVVPCIGLRIEVGDLREESLGYIWNNSEILKNLRDRGKLEGKCGECEYKYGCGGCRSAAYHSHGRIMAEDTSCWYKPRLLP